MRSVRVGISVIHDDFRLLLDVDCFELSSQLRLKID
jgi:hypothetical protein